METRDHNQLLLVAAEVHNVQDRLQNLIMRVPTSELRNALTEINIHLLSAMSAANKAIKLSE